MATKEQMGRAIGAACAKALYGNLPMPDLTEREREVLQERFHTTDPVILSIDAAAQAKLARVSLERCRACISRMPPAAAEQGLQAMDALLRQIDDLVEVLKGEFKQGMEKRREEKK